MPKLVFRNLDRTLEVSEGETILDAAIAADVPIQHACGGYCACTTCHVKVLEGGDRLSPIEEDEEERLDAADGMDVRSRLGCQARVQGDVVVEVVNVGD